jgi:hypothetical protein
VPYGFGSNPLTIRLLLNPSPTPPLAYPMDQTSLPGCVLNVSITLFIAKRVFSCVSRVPVFNSACTFIITLVCNTFVNNHVVSVLHFNLPMQSLNSAAILASLV